MAEALGSDPGVEVKKDTDLVWLETVDPTIPVDRTIERLFVNVIDNMNASGYTEEQVHCVQEEFAKCVPSMSVSAPAAWVGLWEAVLIAEKPPMDPANKTCDEPSTAAIICEVCPD